MQHLRRLSGRRRARSDAGEFVIDGPTLVTEAIEAATRVLEVYVEPDAPTDVIALAERHDIAVHHLAAGTLAQVTSPVTPQPVAALAAIPAPALPAELSGLVLVLVGVADPGNAGTLVRVAEAAGASAVVCCADAVDLWNPKCVRAAAGSLFRVPVRDAGSFDAAMTELRRASLTVLACAAGSSGSHDEVDLRGDVAILLGNEAHGLDPSMVAAADAVVSVPMAGSVESLNVAMTGTVIAFESARQRRAGSARP